MSASWISNLDKLRLAHPEAVDKGLRAAAEVPRSRIVRRLMRGYTTGAYSNKAAGVAGSVTVSNPQTDENGERVILLGTNKKSDAISPKYGERFSYPLGWELGFFSIFTGQYERVEIWAPAMAETRLEQAQAFAKVYRKVMADALPRDLRSERIAAKRAGEI